jgi:nitrous oxide reductase
MGTATTLGIVAGGLFAGGGSSTARTQSHSTVAATQPFMELAGLFPYWSENQAGLVAVGTLR